MAQHYDQERPMKKKSKKPEPLCETEYEPFVFRKKRLCVPEQRTKEEDFECHAPDYLERSERTF
jgi:hypothetical protein